MDKSGRFDFCVDFVLAHETEYNANGSVKVEHDPSDPGGTTKYGIDQRDHPEVDVANLTLQQAKQIYRLDEWARCRCEELKAPWDLALFDTAVNIGSSRAVRMMQEALGVTVDGHIGPKTLAAAEASSITAVERFLDLREKYYRGLSLTLRASYLKGWLNRVANLRAASILAREGLIA